MPVYASGGEQIGTVDHVVAAPDEDIFHGIVMRLGNDPRFVPAEQIAALHEFGVDLTIDEAAAGALDAPHGAAPVYHDSEPGAKPSAWRHFVKTTAARRHRRLEARALAPSLISAYDASAVRQRLERRRDHLESHRRRSHRIAVAHAHPEQRAALGLSGRQCLHLRDARLAPLRPGSGSSTIQRPL